MPIIKCDNCGKEFYKPNYRIRGHEHHYCSRLCGGNANYVPIIKRLWAKVERHGPDECWEWQGAKKGHMGYGSIGLDSYRTISVHRVVYELTYGKIPARLCVLHSCDNPRCCNPKHLFLGTNQDNMTDMKKKGRAANQKGINNPRCKLRPIEVLEIRRLYATGRISQEYLGKIFNVKQVTVSKITTRANWKDLSSR